jgi:hypothetical protein
VAPRNLPMVIDHDPEPELDVSKLMEAARDARIIFAGRRRAKIRRLAGWAAFSLCAVAPVAFAALAPEIVVMAAPASITAYQKLGYDINVYGLEISHVEQQNQLVDGQRQFIVKGQVSNPGSDMRKIPWLRFALVDEAGRELYGWTLDTASRPLHPGEKTAFNTRISGPPEHGTSLQIRFAHANEIGLNPGS